MIRASVEPALKEKAEDVLAHLGLPGAESRALVEAIAGEITAPHNVYRHKWRPKDLVLWDSLLLQHARSNFDNAQRRTLRRCAIAHDREPQYV